MNMMVDDFMELIHKTSTSELNTKLSAYLIDNHINDQRGITILKEEIHNRLEAKEKAATIVGGLFVPVVLGYLVFLLENDSIRSTPEYFGIALLAMVVFVIAVYALTIWLVGKKGFAWKMRKAISVLHEQELKGLIDEVGKN